MDPASEPGSPGPDDVEPGVENSVLRLQRYLDAIGVPWRETYAALVDRYGISGDCTDGSDVVSIETVRPFVRGMLYPLQLRAGDHREPNAPVGKFETNVSYGLGASENLRQAVLLLQPVLGTGTPRDYADGHVWRFGRSYVDLERGHDPAPDGTDFERQLQVARLEASCRLTIVNGWRRALDAADRAAVSGFVPIFQFDEGLQQTAIFNPILMDQWAYLREPDAEQAGLYRWLGWSGDRATLIVFNTQFYMIPVDDILSLEVTRIVPARGAGGSSLHLTCRSQRGDGAQRWLEVATGSDPDQLTEPAQRIADAIGKPVTLRPYEADA
jgi:hypothetical protein